MALTDSEKLYIAELVFYAPALPLAAFVAFRHGFGRSQGWLFLVLLGICRLVGAACGIAAIQSMTNNQGLYEAAAICGSIGISFLTQALIGITKRVNEGLGQDGIAIITRVLNVLTTALIPGVVLGIIGGIDQASVNDPSSVSNGHTYTKAAVILFAVVILILAGIIIILTALKLKSIAPGERNLLFAAIASWPFLFVRVLYSLIAVCNPDSADFNIYKPDVLVEGLMAVMEEFIIVIILLAIGFITPTIDRSMVQGGRRKAPQEASSQPPQEQYGNGSNLQQYPAGDMGYGANRSAV